MKLLLLCKIIENCQKIYLFLTVNFNDRVLVLYVKIFKSFKFCKFLLSITAETGIQNHLKFKFKFENRVFYGLKKYTILLNLYNFEIA